jgi:8-oxo-dGTP pyrophosphatase MutT (NUDIX family)
MSAMPSLCEIRRALSAHTPATVPQPGQRRAAVAVVLREAAGAAEVLFIERALRAGDPWSGHMAFPGGRIEPGDPDTRRAAERETLEEVGVDLSAAERLGRLDDLHGQHVAGVPRLVISAFVYHLSDPPPLAPNHEVQAAFWFPLSRLFEPQRHVEYRVGAEGFRPFPGILVGEPERHVVWGLTYRFLEVFFRALGRPLPDRWEGLRAARTLL